MCARKQHIIGSRASMYARVWVHLVGTWQEELAGTPVNCYHY